MKAKMILVALLSATFLQANSFTYTKYVNVTKSKPVYKMITKRVPYQECWDEQVPVRQKHRNSNNNDVVGTIIGGVAGGVLGHQIGKGRGNTAATVGGAIIGSIIGQNIGSQNDRYYIDEPTRYVTKRKCITKYKESREKRFEGYKNIGFFKGKKIAKFSKHKLHSIPVTITVDY